MNTGREDFYRDLESGAFTNGFGDVCSCLIRGFLWGIIWLIFKFLHFILRDDFFKRQCNKLSKIISDIFECENDENKI